MKILRFLETYKSTLLNCYLANIVHAIQTTFISILMSPLKEEYSLSYEQIGKLTLISFIGQIFSDIGCSPFLDRMGYKYFVIAAPIINAFGLLIFAFTPYLFSNVYITFTIGSFITGVGGGLGELLASSIVNSIPSDDPAVQMGYSHSVYAVGQILTVSLLSLYLHFVNYSYWYYIMYILMIPSIIQAVYSCYIPYPKQIQDEWGHISMIELLDQKFLYYVMIQIMVGSAAEVIMVEWPSTYMEKGLHIPKLVGDLIGVSLFALFLGIGRVLFAKNSQKIKLSPLLIASALLVTICYLLMSLSPYNWITILCCGICGFGCSMLWPGCLIIAYTRYPMAGPSLVGILAAAGDIGAGFGPFLMGLIADIIQHSNKLEYISKKLQITPEQFGLRGSLLLTTIFPLLTSIAAYTTWIKRRIEYQQCSNNEEACDDNNINNFAVTVDSSNNIIEIGIINKYENKKDVKRGADDGCGILVDMPLKPKDYVDPAYI